MSIQGRVVKQVKKHTEITAKEKQARKEQVLTQGRPSITRSIADAITIKKGDIYFLSQSDGNVPLGGSHGFGLYYHDCRYLSGYHFQLADGESIVLIGTSTTVGNAIFELTNPQLQLGEGEHVSTGDIGITWERALDSDQIQLTDRFHIVNYSQEPVEFEISFTFQADFEDVFAIRGLLSERPGDLHPPAWKEKDLFFSYDGKDGLNRSTEIHFSPQPTDIDLNTVHYQINLSPGANQDVKISLNISETGQKTQPNSVKTDTDDTSVKTANDWLQSMASIETDSLLINQILERSMLDLFSLKSTLRGKEFFAAGIPWFTTLFGRDSLITGMQMLAYKPEIAADTLRLLASYQAREVDQWRDAQPGKILHELRIGELARLSEIPQTPYYGTVDATPLFLILIAEYVSWSGDLSLFNELRSSIDLAIEWIDKYGDSAGFGYVDYQSTSRNGLINQGWKDSGNAILGVDGNLAKPPIALVEVQGYVYRAKIAIAHLFEKVGQADRANELQKSAQALRSKFNRDFWDENLGTYVLALQAHGDPVAVVSSNPGQVLWTGIADPDKARKTADRLMAEDMFNGWGIRTLSRKAKAYNPIGYHLGTVWPHDNAIIAAGFRRYGFDHDAKKILSGILEATLNFKEFRLPELFSGFSRDEYSVPVHYPVACHPQAWAAGSIPFLLSTFLGLEPDALEHKLEICKPILPDSTNSLKLRGLRVGKASTDIQFSRDDGGKTIAKVLKIDGDLEVKITNR